VVFCCAGLLLRRERLEAVLNTLPERRRQEIRERLAEVFDWSPAQLTAQLITMRQEDTAEAMRRCGMASQERLESLSAPLERWLYARAWESNGREDH
jgi:hypothetical protein